jgi:acrylyl-CoA reductase (NADPH)
VTAATAPDTFRAFTAAAAEGGFERGVTELRRTDLPDDGVLLSVQWSSVNYKDSLAASPNGRVARISPLVVGIDLAGEVLESDDDAFSPGDAVLAHGYDLGVSRHGGFAELARVPAQWLVPLPEGLTPQEAMTIGTAGYTAALSVLALQDHGIEPRTGAVLVTGATGGVGSMAVSMLAGLGYDVVASTGKGEAEAYLQALGAKEVVGRDELTDTPKPLLRPAWAAAVDCVGGETLAGVLARLDYGGAVAASGNTGGMSLPTTVLPFILRGVSLLGIDSVQTPIERRRQVWRRLGGDLKPAHLDRAGTEVALDDVGSALDEIAGGGVTGRYVVRVGRG